LNLKIKPVIGSSHPTVFNKPKPIIQKITFNSTETQEIKDIMDGKPTKKMIDSWQRRGVLKTEYFRPPSLNNRKDDVKRKYFHGLCHICQDLPVYKVLYKLPDITLVEYYCNKHVPDMKS
jgi:hypothetical protein